MTAQTPTTAEIEKWLRIRAGVAQKNEATEAWKMLRRVPT